jgi:hypothetical protein
MERYVVAGSRVNAQKQLLAMLGAELPGCEFTVIRWEETGNVPDAWLHRYHVDEGYDGA